MPYKNYFNNINYFLERRIGISKFSANQADLDQFTIELQNHDLKILELKASDIASYNSLPDIESTEFDFFLFFQDIPYNELKNSIFKIIHDYIFPIHYKCIPIAFFSALDKTDYTNIQIQSSEIHSDIDKVQNLLLIEQLYHLLAPVNIDIFKENDFEQRDLLTPIEKFLSDEMLENNISFKPQVKMGRFYVDFLVEHKNKKLIVECDERDYHNPNLDKERDKELSKHKIPILRLTGSEIYWSPEKCIEKIQQSFRYQHRITNYQIDKNLDESQSKPLSHITGPCRVLAPAGSGKTKTLVNRIAYLLNNNVGNDRILALAFNKKAAEEMTKRLSDNHIDVTNQMSNSGVVIKTFHSFGYEIIRQYLKWKFDGKTANLETRKKMASAIRSNFDNNEIPGYKMQDAIDKGLEAMRRAKMELKPKEDLEFEVDNHTYSFSEVFNEYLRKQYDHNFMNFDDMIYLAVRILLDNPQARHLIQNRFQYILVDEFQDLTEAQLLLMNIVAQPENNLFIVGDDDQMIYGWRGAKINHILDFPITFKTSKDFTLSTNYRSNKKLVKQSNWLIKHNTKRVDKDIKPRLNADSGIFKIETATNLHEQALKAAEWIKNLRENHAEDWHHTAVLFRYHEYQFPLAMVLDSQQIPHTPVDKDRLFTKNPGKDLHTYLSIILYPNDASADDFSRVLKRPNKYLTNSLVSNATDWQSFSNLDNTSEKDWMKEKVNKFINQITSIQNRIDSDITSPAQLTQEIYDIFGFKQFYEDAARVNQDIDKASDVTIMEVLISMAKLFNNIQDFYAEIHRAITEPDIDHTNEATDNKNMIQLSTIHSTKGNEFRNVVYFNLAKSQKNLYQTELEEERRVCYVGVTRAINNILITTTKDNHSPFLEELIRNPLFKKESQVQLNNLLAQANIEKEQTEGKINHLKHEIEGIKNNHPELTGKELQVNVQSIEVGKRNKIGSLKNKFPELIGEPLKSNFSIFKNYFTNRRRIKIEKAEQKVKSLEQKIDSAVNQEIELRKHTINNASNKIDEINKNIQQLYKNDLQIKTDKIEEIKSELEYREIIPLNN